MSGFGEGALETVSGAGVWLTIDGGCAEITLARAAQRNTLDSQALKGLATALQRIDDDPTVHGAILRSGVEGVFCSGGNYVDPGRPGEPSSQYGPQLTACFARWTARQFPIVSVVDGSARAFGAALALTSDITLATPTASFGLPELSGGVVPSFAIALLRTRHTTRLVRELTLTAAAINAEEAARRGLINLVSDHGDAEQQARTLLTVWSKIGASAVREAMRTFAEIDAAHDQAAVLEIAMSGLEDQLWRFRAGDADQSYLGLDTTVRYLWQTGQ
jgi:enoyl-CoA hydratase/carnithine racemase